MQSSEASRQSCKPRSILEISREVGIRGDADDLRRKPRPHRAVLRRVEKSSSSYAPYDVPEPNLYTEVEDPYIEVADLDVSDEWTDVSDELKRKKQPGSSTEDAGVKGEVHYEFSWPSAGPQDEQSETRRMAHAQSTKRSDLRLCCYYTLCIWAVTFLMIGAGFFAASAMPASACDQIKRAGLIVLFPATPVRKFFEKSCARVVKLRARRFGV